MTTIFKRYYLGLIILLLAYAGCNFQKTSKKDQDNPPDKSHIDSSNTGAFYVLAQMDRIQLYCYGYYYLLQSDTQRLRRIDGPIGTTPFSSNPSALIRPGLLHTTTTDSLKINVLYQFLTNGHNIVEQKKGVTDARVTILFTNKEKDSVWLSPVDNHTFVVNDSIVYRYRVPIMDTVCKYLNLKEIKCK